MSKNELDNTDFERCFIQEIINNVGARLPTSEEEKKAASLVKSKFSSITKNDAKVESFRCHPLASIGAIPLIGFIELILIIPLYIFTPLAAGILNIFILLFAIIQIFKYKGWFDRLFPSGESQNVYSILEPPTGTVKYTLLLCGHIDSSWNCKLFLKNPKKSSLKIIYGVVCAVMLMIAAFLKSIGWIGLWSNFLIIVFIPGFWYLSQYLSWNKKIASPGAMDNLSGLAISMWIAKYFSDHPEVHPANCRIILVGFGCEESGLKGSEIFVEKHKNDLLKGHVWALNVDGVSDYDYFHVVDGDAWLGTKYDETFCTLAEKAMKSIDIEFDRIKNPAGGTDSASFSRAGIRTVTLAAQDPGPGLNYHTFDDTLENLDFRSIKIMEKVVLELIKNVTDFEKNNPDID